MRIHALKPGGYAPLCGSQPASGASTTTVPGMVNCPACLAVAEAANHLRAELRRAMKPAADAAARKVRESVRDSYQPPGDRYAAEAAAADKRDSDAIDTIGAALLIVAAIAWTLLAIVGIIDILQRVL